MSPSTPTTDRKTEILEAAQDFLQVKGYAGFSYRDLSDRLGIAKPSIHHHFATKEDLALALMDRYAEMLEAYRAEVATYADRPADFLRAVLAQEAEELACNEHSLCPGGAMHANYEVFPESVRARVRQLNDAMHAMWVDLLRAGRELGQIHFRGTPEQAAWTLSSLLMGARQHARAAGPQVWAEVSRHIEVDWLSTS